MKQEGLKEYLESSKIITGLYCNIVPDNDTIIENLANGIEQEWRIIIWWIAQYIDSKKNENILKTNIIDGGKQIEIKFISYFDLLNESNKYTHLSSKLREKYKGFGVLMVYMILLYCIESQKDILISWKPWCTKKFWERFSLPYIQWPNNANDNYYYATWKSLKDSSVEGDLKIAYIAYRDYCKHYN